MTVEWLLWVVHNNDKLRYSLLAEYDKESSASAEYKDLIEERLNKKEAREAAEGEAKPGTPPA